MEVTNGGAVLHVVESGDPSAPTVVLVHGYPDTHGCWDELAELLSERFHVVAYDVRGMGRSTAPDGPDAYALPVLAADLGAVIDAVSPGARVHLVGHDWGSFQCWEAITTEPLADRIASFTAVAGPRIDAAAAWALRRLRPSVRTLRQLAAQTRRSWYIGAFMIPRVPDLAVGVAMERGWPEAMRRLEGIEPRPGHPAATIASDARRGIALYRTNFPRLRVPVEVRPSRVPVQLVVPTRDRYISTGIYDDGAEWAEQVWRREVRTGHWAQRTHPQAVARYVAELVEHAEGAPEAPALRRARWTGARRGYEGRLAVVTGAGSGIGRATALALAARGAEVVAADINLGTAEETVALSEASDRVHAYRVDVGDAAAMESFAAAIADAYGVPSIVVNNAGIGIGGPMLDMELADWQRIVDINLWGVIHGVRLFGRLMVDAGVEGQIVNTASMAAYTPSRVLGAYSMTKAGVLMLSECLRAELAGDGIGVSAICPGVINTNITRTTQMVGVSEDEQARMQARGAELYARRNYGPEKVAAAILGAIDRNTPVRPVAPEAHAARVMSQLSPALMRRLARLDPKV
jgi:NAD(P)-dependent dehydrogenase (short-subunit alcohol dehydrogenase family)/pimeloyl-ACP methyl ester carboxylesterase